MKRFALLLTLALAVPLWAAPAPLPKEPLSVRSLTPDLLVGQWQVRWSYSHYLFTFHDNGRLYIDNFWVMNLKDYDGGVVASWRMEGDKLLVKEQARFRFWNGLRWSVVFERNRLGAFDYDRLSGRAFFNEGSVKLTLTREKSKRPARDWR